MLNIPENKIIGFTWVYRGIVPIIPRTAIYDDNKPLSPELKTSFRRDLGKGYYFVFVRTGKELAK